ncbi:MAG: serine/threonine-protein kinase [Chloroflexota bacterium]|nr:serine/threonine protein kinase [Chloroflexota bacterium]
MNYQKALLQDGSTVEYELVDDPPSGSMKKTYFSPDRSYVVQFYHDAAVGADPQRRERLEAILTRYNPTLSEAQGGAKGNSPTQADYYKNLFCWPTGIVVKPQLGIVAPFYPSNFFFKQGSLKNHEKEGSWFSRTKARRLLPAQELGSWDKYLEFCILMARSVRRLHQAGLAHSDLSTKNILVDPIGGQCVVLDIDSLVVPEVFPPDVLGTPGYIAPEVLATSTLALRDPKRKHPGATTDQHALAVLIYEYLLLRHPLKGPKTYAAQTAEEQERLEMGEKALFIENPTDQSNRSRELKVPYRKLGSYLSDLIYRAFVKGLHSPNDRPAAIEWERALIKTWDLLLPCSNPTCAQQWFVYDPSGLRCPFCGTRLRPAWPTFPLLKLFREGPPEVWRPDGEVVLWHNHSLFKWHVFTGIFPGPDSRDKTPQAYCLFHQGEWWLVNQNLFSLISPEGDRIGQGEALLLTNGLKFRLSQEPESRTVEVELIQISG